MSTIRSEILTRAEGPVRDGQDDQAYEITYRFDSEFVAFSGHFPGYPILPAFVQLLAGECALQLRRRRPLVLRRARRAKFLKPVLPNQVVTLCWNERTLPDGLKGSFTLLADGEKAATFTLEMATEGTGNV